MTGSPQDWRDLVARFSGNSLALKVVAASIRELFGGAIASFMRLEDAAASTVFAGIRRLLGEQIARVHGEIRRAIAARAQDAWAGTFCLPRGAPFTASATSMFPRTALE